MSVRIPQTRALAVLGLMAAAALVGSSPPADAHSRKHRHHHRSHVVEAPFTTVATRHRRETHVWAPFTRVHVTSAGTYVRAPFVDLFVPR